MRKAKDPSVWIVFLWVEIFDIVRLEIKGKAVHRCRLESDVTKASRFAGLPLASALHAVMPSGFVMLGETHVLAFVDKPCELPKASGGNQTSQASTPGHSLRTCFVVPIPHLVWAIRGKSISCVSV